jgi:hypothetical protein
MATTTPSTSIGQASFDPHRASDAGDRAAVDLYWLPLGAGAIACG